MTLNFVQLLQDSWNFIRNQRQFALFAVGTLLTVQLLSRFLQTLVLPSESAVNENPMAMLSGDAMLFQLLTAIVGVLINLLITFNIKAINEGQFGSFFQVLDKAFKGLFPILIVVLISVLPISLGMSAVVFARGDVTMSLIALPLMVTGLYVYIKLSIAIYAYVIENLSGIGQIVKFTWALSRGYFWLLVALNLITAVMPSILISVFSAGGTSVLEYLAIFVSAFLNVFVIVFGFRFYQVFRQLPRK